MLDFDAIARDFERNRERILKRLRKRLAADDRRRDVKPTGGERVRDLYYNKPVKKPKDVYDTMKSFLGWCSDDEGKVLGMTNKQADGLRKKRITADDIVELHEILNESLDVKEIIRKL